MFGAVRQGRRGDVVRDLCGAARSVPDLHARRSRMWNGAETAWPAGASPTCAESHPPYRQINALAKKLALHFWCGVKIRRCVRELASVARRGAFALAGRYRDD